MKRTIVCMGVVALLLAACATVGRDFPVDPVAEIRIGQTTREQIGRMFGPPWRTGLEDGSLTWTYGYYRYNLFGPSRTRDLVVRFDPNGVVRSYTYNSDAPQPPGQR